MTSEVTWFEPMLARRGSALVATPVDLPARFASPFDASAPHPLARRAADALLAELARRTDTLDAPGGGKMFGVLVVAAPDGRLGYLRGFSGMLDGAWLVPGFVPPLYDPAARDAIWPAGQTQLRTLELALRALDASPAYATARAAHASVVARHADELAALQARHRSQRDQRRAARIAADAVARHALDQASRADTAERRRLDATQADELAADERAIFDAERARLERQRADESRALMIQVHDSYVIENARGERRPLRALFAPGEPAGGAGDCAGPKLLGRAYRLGLTPIALAELWWGAPPLTGGRTRGQLYPSCRGKCGPILPFMLEGLAHDAAPIFGAGAIPADEPRVVFEDAFLLVVDKPCGLLSVPGRSGLLADSVLTRLRARHGDVSVVHRLDLDTSGLLIAAKDAATHAALQRAFAQREVTKRYAAWLDGAVAADHGTVDLPLRVDLDDRPRQIVDPIHGKPATTTWHVVDRRAARTRVALIPHTGRTHQLRVHAAHALGINAPIVGDRLYGRAADRLLLHAESLSFTHPHTGARIDLTRPAPF